MKEIPEPIDFGDDIPTLENAEPIHFAGFEVVPIENRNINEGDVLVRTHPVGQEFTYLKKYTVSSDDRSGRIGIFNEFGAFLSIGTLIPERWGVFVEHDFDRPADSMTPDEYVEAAMITASDLYKSTFSAHSMGLMIEAAEYSDLMHKAYHHDKEIKSEDIVSELGDIAWMLACACHFHRVKLSDVMRSNLDKLKKRHGNKYNADHYKA